MKKKQILFLLVIVIIVVFCIFRKQICYETYRKLNVISAGSYPNAETYNLNFSETEVKQALKEFKSLHPEYAVNKFDDHQTSFWNITYFKVGNEIAYTYTRENGKSETTFALVQVQKNSENSWKEINRDFNYSQNKTHIEKFEKRILKVLNDILKKNKAAGNSGLKQ